MKHNRYRNLRKSIKLTQQEVAKILNIAQTAVSKWELGQTIPDQAILPKIAELYNTTVDYLLTGKEPYVVYKPAESATKRRKSELDIMIEALNDYQKERLKGYIIRMLEDEGIDLNKILKNVN